jgi:hypothetical protein
MAISLFITVQVVSFEQESGHHYGEHSTAIVSSIAVDIDDDNICLRHSDSKNQCSINASRPIGIQTQCTELL